MGGGRPEDELLVGRPRVGEGVPVQAHATDGRVVEDLHAEVLFVDAVFGPPPAEIRIGYGQASHQGGELRVVGVMRRLAPQHSHARAGHASQSSYNRLIAGTVKVMTM